MNRLEVSRYIRFQLAELSARNGEHDFETLCYHLAKARVASNLVPATGPVQAGGDQGRDFETYHTFQRDAGVNLNFTARIDGEEIVFACTLNKRSEEKLRADLASIFGKGEPPKFVYYLCEPNVPVALRHKLQQFCSQTYRARLEILDGQWIADHLADRDTVWIAEQFLSLPAEMSADISMVAASGETDDVNREDVGARYMELRQRWLVDKSQPHNFADFLQIKQGLRTAIFDKERTADLPHWIVAMSAFLDTSEPTRLVQRARYEISVAELRGLGSLDPALFLVAAFFNELSVETSSAELLDAAILFMYSSGAHERGEASLDTETLRNWIDRLDGIFSAALSGTLSRGDRCTVLQAQAMLGMVPRTDDWTSDELRDRVIQLWNAFIDEVRDVPLYPISEIADVVEMFVANVPTTRALRELASSVDELVADRAGTGESGERARLRSIRHLDSGNHIAAIDELQRVKVDWFNGDTVDGSVLAMLLLSQTYEELRLFAAARYYAAGALYVSSRYGGDAILRRLGQAAIRISDTFHAAGEGLTFFYSLRHALEVHAMVASDPGNWESHTDLRRAVRHAAITRCIATKMAPDLIGSIDSVVATWPFSDSGRAAFIEMSETSPISSMGLADLRRQLASEMGCNPFSDVGKQREIDWFALGMRWTVGCRQDRDVWFAAAGFAAALQITQVEFAEVDLNIIPSQARLYIELDEVDDPRIIPLPDNEALSWKVILPRSVDNDDLRASFAGPLAVAVTALRLATALPHEQFEALVAKRMERDLAVRVVSVRPARELLAIAQPDALSDLSILNNLSAVTFSPAPIEPKELTWRDGPGPGYSFELATKLIENRYDKASRALRVTLPRIRADQRCQAIIARLRSRGMLDWQILTAFTNIVCPWQVTRQFGRPASRDALQQWNEFVIERAYREEHEDDPLFDLSVITLKAMTAQDEMLTVSAFHTWDLVNHRSTPPVIGMKRLLDARYGHSTDDIPHDDPFATIEG